MDTEYYLRNSERFTRFVIGFSLVLSIMIFPITSAWIAAVCFVATYPLLTALLAIDPIFLLLDLFAKRTTNLSLDHAISQA